ncbi:MAG: helix-turn-helix transcriptional regulator [Pseudomonadota bacterium]
MSQHNKSTLTVTEAASHLQRTPRTLYRWMASGKLPYVVRDDGRRVIPIDNVVNLSQTCRKTLSSSQVDGHGLCLRLQALERNHRRVVALLHDMLSLIPAESMDALQRKQLMRDSLADIIQGQRDYPHG